MHLLFLTNFLKEEIIRAICWTLIHSLWQGLLLAVVAGAVMLFTKRATSFFRYNFLAVLFFVFLVASGYTLFREMQNAETYNPTGAVHFSTGTIVAGQETIVSSKSTGQNFLEQMAAYFNEHAPLVVTIWFIIFGFRFVKLLSNLVYIQKVRHSKTHEPSSDWKLKMQKLARRLGIKKQVMLLESEIVKTPVMVGFLKPVILFPFSMLSQLPPEQVEAVLLHELAHIKRKDYFVNLLQNLAEIVFFFNPAVLWISSLIRDERENCCDDMAIRQTKSKEKFIHALVAFQEYNLSSEYSLAFKGQKNHLLNRIKRIINHSNQTLNTMEKIFLTGCLLTMTFLTVAFSQTEPVKVPKQPSIEKTEIASVPDAPIISDIKAVAVEPVPPVITAVPEIPDVLVSPEKDTIPKAPKETNTITVDQDDMIIYVRNGYRIVTNHNKITEAYYHDERIPDDKLQGMRPMLEKLVQEQKMESLQDMTQNEMPQELMEKVNKAMMDAKMAELMEQQNKAQIENELLERKMEIEGLDKMKDEKLQLEKMQLDLQNNIDLKNKVELDLQNNTKNEALAELYLQKAQLDEQKQTLLAKKFAEQWARQNANYIDPILGELKESGIIKDSKNVSFELTNEKFVVNNVKQPTEIFKKYKDKYIKSPKEHIIYSTNKGSVHTDINIDR
ncbi:MAG TPA: M56 family metallopeptidase [Puia sp.]|nr:M56 family metallopeptidase [Puia sp.]